MPARVTLESILPVICTELRIDPSEIERPVTKQKFAEVLTVTETVVTPRIIDRLWYTLSKSAYAHHSAYRSDALVLDVRAVWTMIAVSRHTTLSAYTQTDRHTHTQDDQAQEGSE